MGNLAYGIPIDALIAPLEWMAGLMVVALLVDAAGRRKGEPEAPARPEIHAQVETWLRDPSTATNAKRI